MLNAVPDYALPRLLFIPFGAVLDMFPLAGAHGNIEGLGPPAATSSARVKGWRAAPVTVTSLH